MAEETESTATDTDVTPLTIDEEQGQVSLLDRVAQEANLSEPNYQIPEAAKVPFTPRTLQEDELFASSEKLADVAPPCCVVVWY